MLYLNRCLIYYILYFLENISIYLSEFLLLLFVSCSNNNIAILSVFVFETDWAIVRSVNPCLVSFPATQNTYWKTRSTPSSDDVIVTPLLFRVHRKMFCISQAHGGNWSGSVTLRNMDKPDSQISGFSSQRRTTVHKSGERWWALKFPSSH